MSAWRNKTHKRFNGTSNHRYLCCPCRVQFSAALTIFLSAEWYGLCRFNTLESCRSNLGGITLATVIEGHSVSGSFKKEPGFHGSEVVSLRKRELMQGGSAECNDLSRSLNFPVSGRSNRLPEGQQEEHRNLSSDGWRTADHPVSSLLADGESF